jgi:hypothetical protein
MAQYLTAKEAKQIAETRMGFLEKALQMIEARAQQGELEHAFGSMNIPLSIIDKLRKLGYVVQPEGRVTHVSWK